jgi:hypothetical protein
MIGHKGSETLSQLSKHLRPVSDRWRQVGVKLPTLWRERYEIKLSRGLCGLVVMGQSAASIISRSERSVPRGFYASSITIITSR